MRRTGDRLSDGRQILYFDAGDTARTRCPDRRALPPMPPPSSEIRYDPLLDEWVAVAAHRQTRTLLPSSDRCPLCPSGPGRDTEIPAADYEVVVFENRFPSFAGPPAAVEAGLVTRSVGAGRCEVVCFTSDHTTSFARLSAQRVRLVIEAWADRTTELGALPGVEQVFCFENRGQEIGVTLHHPHGQIYAYPFVTPRTRRQLACARGHRDRTRRDLFTDLLDYERRSGERIVRESDHWTTFVPAFARWPVEVHLYPRRRVPDLPALTDAERDDLAVCYLDLLGRLDRLHDAPLPYLACWHQAPVRVGRDLARLHLQLFSPQRTATTLKYLAGSEAGMGVFVNDVAPEEIAARLRDAGTHP